MTEPLQRERAVFVDRGRPRLLAGGVREAFFSSLSRELRLSLGADERIRIVEGAWQPIAGWRPERLVGWRWDEVLHHADRARFAEALEQVTERRVDQCRVEARLARATGGYCAVSWTLGPGAGPDQVFAVGVEDAASAPDDAGALAREAQLRAQVEHLERRLAATETFAGMAAHQLAEPLIIAESAAILVAEELGASIDPFLRSRLEAISRGASRARRLMDALLEDARASAQPPDLRSVDVGDVVEQTLSAFESRLEDHQIAVEVGPLPSVLADPRLLAVVLDNLVVNAIKHGPRRRGVISIGASRVEEGWRIHLTSGGPPIAPQDRRRILQPYVRLPGERRVSGSGLGLAICVRLIERMSGTLDIEAGRTEGNTVFFVLPAAPTA